MDITKHMKTNEHILRITGATSLPEPLNQGCRYSIKVEADVCEISNRDNQDGTIDITYKAKMTGNTEILTEGKKIIKAEAKGSRSKKLHGAIWFLHNTLGSDQPFDQFYDEVMRKMTAYLPEIIEFINNKS